MNQGVFQSVAIGVFIAAFFVSDFYYMSMYDSKRGEGAKGWGWAYTTFAIIFCLLVILQPVVWPWLGWTISSPFGFAVQIIGICCGVIGTGLHIWARKHLQEFYVERVEVQNEHRLVETGPYSLMRHPVFSSFFMVAFGFLLINPAVSTIVMLAYALFDFSGSARREEELLSKEVPGYKEYMTRVPRFFPRIFRSR